MRCGVVVLTKLRVTAWNRVAVEINVPPVLVIRGPNGAGKSTILRAVNALVEGHSGGGPWAAEGEWTGYHPLRVQRSYLPEHSLEVWGGGSARTLRERQAMIDATIGRGEPRWSTEDWLRLSATARLTAATHAGLMRGATREAVDARLEAATLDDLAVLAGLTIGARPPAPGEILEALRERLNGVQREIVGIRAGSADASRRLAEHPGPPGTVADRLAEIDRLRAQETALAVALQAARMAHAQRLARETQLHNLTTRIAATEQAADPARVELATAVHREAERLYTEAVRLHSEAFARHQAARQHRAAEAIRAKLAAERVAADVDLDQIDTEIAAAEQAVEAALALTDRAAGAGPALALISPIVRWVDDHPNAGDEPTRIMAATVEALRAAVSDDGRTQAREARVRALEQVTALRDRRARAAMAQVRTAALRGELAALGVEEDAAPVPEEDLDDLDVLEERRDEQARRLSDAGRALTAAQARAAKADAELPGLIDLRAEILAQAPPSNADQAAPAKALDQVVAQRQAYEREARLLSDRATWQAAVAAAEGEIAKREALRARIRTAGEALRAAMTAAEAADAERLLWVGNQIVEGVIGSSLALDATARGGVDVTLGGTPYAALPTSHQALVAVAFHVAACAGRSGWRRVVLDDLEHLEPALRVRLVAALVGAADAGHVDNAIVGCVDDGHAGYPAPVLDLPRRG